MSGPLLTSPRILTVPGYTGSGPQHWQSVWVREGSRMQRIEQEDAGCLRVFALASDSRFEVLHQSRCQRRQSGVGIVAKIGINGFDRMGESPRTLMKIAGGPETAGHLLTFDSVHGRWRRAIEAHGRTQS